MAIFYLVYTLWFISEVILNRLMRSGKSDLKGRDRGSLIIIWLTIILAMGLGVFLSIRYRMPIVPSALFQYAGLGVIIAGMIIRFIAIRSLGKYFTVDVTIREGHQLKTDGMYRLVRHPSYTGSLISFLGYGMTLDSWPGLLAVVIPVTVVMIYRIRIEERLLTEQFGQEYRNYMLNSKRLLPWIY